MKIRTLFLVLIIALGSYMVLLTVAEMPPYGAMDNPTNNEVTQRYIEDSLEETGVVNMVTSIVIDYRAYDTMYETIVLFTAAIAALVALKVDERRGE
jgi:multisubunit Na+/H+ antiporter MnhB subunit